MNTTKIALAMIMILSLMTSQEVLAKADTHPHKQMVKPKFTKLNTVTNPKPIPKKLKNSIVKSIKKSIIGIASYYGYESGPITASGEKFNPKKFTAAHRTLPMGTMVKVTNTVNNKSVIVKINDRGPFKKSRIIDLSKYAALSIGIKGTEKVELAILPTM